MQNVSDDCFLRFQLNNPFLFGILVFLCAWIFCSHSLMLMRWFAISVLKKRVKNEQWFHFRTKLRNSIVGYGFDVAVNVRVCVCVCVHDFTNAHCRLTVDVFWGQNSWSLSIEFIWRPHKASETCYFRFVESQCCEIGRWHRRALNGMLNARWHLHVCNKSGDEEENALTN